MNPISLLREIIAQGGPVTSDFYGDNASFALLSRVGLLREVGVVSSVVCCDCDAPHSAQVVFAHGKHGYLCPDLGFVALAHSSIKEFGPDISALIERLAEVFEVRQRKSSSIYGETWRIGALRSNVGSVMLYFRPNLQNENDARELRSALEREVRADWRLVLTSEGKLPIAGLVVAQLDDIVEIDAETGDLRSIADAETLAGVPRRVTGGRPSEHGHLLKPLIEDRIKNGKSTTAVGAEARAVRAAFQAAYPDKPIPSDPTIKRYVRAALGGS
ncbi:hypothetical protein [Flavimaricola marinus]|uniref:Uncharacterized protein n=1 Tax=Flavimaricola marinus TaxID=1819565 RepID=A0A238LK96_9RHOB|nr:hypothetical protein [Flavimaricola marinus]SMY09953.1 hypothetical protein LOM8899_04126 [Flavimaricola marinus]